MKFTPTSKIVEAFYPTIVNKSKKDYKFITPKEVYKLIKYKIWIKD